VPHARSISRPSPGRLGAARVLDAAAPVHVAAHEAGAYAIWLDLQRRGQAQSVGIGALGVTGKEWSTWLVSSLGDWAAASL